MKSSKLGIVSAFIASICCLGPLVLVLLGLGSLGLGAVLGKYHWYFIFIAIGLISYAWWHYLKEKKTCNLQGCQMENKRITLITLIITTMIISIFLTLNLYTFALQRDYKKDQSAIDSAEIKTVIIPVEGMTCFTCEVTISFALKKVTGVKQVNASAKKGEVQVTYNKDKTDLKELIRAINKTGFKAALP